VSRGYFSSRKNLAGMGLALAGLGLHFAGVVGGVWPLVVIGLYGVGALAVPPESRPLTLRIGADPIRDPNAVRARLREIAATLSRKGSVPADVVTATDRITAAISAVLDRLRDQPAGSDDADIVYRIATDYLPETLNTFLRISPRYIDRTGSDGQSPHTMVLAQLRLLADRMDEVGDAIAKGDEDALAAHGRFLADRFRRSSLTVAGGAEGADPKP
jgi:hypothetical protein